MKRLFVVLALGAMAVLSAPAALGQNAGYDLLQTGSGTTLDLGTLGTVTLQGVALESDLGNTDTIVQRTQNGPGQVNVSVYALFMKSTSPITYSGQSADVYVTINNSGGKISTNTLPQPDSLTASGGSVTIYSGGTFDSNLTVYADLIFVKAGTSVGTQSNWLGHQTANSVNLTSTGSSWSSTAPSGSPSNSNYPSGGFYATSVGGTGGGGHSAPGHAHIVAPARCGPGAPLRSSPAVQRALAAGDRQALLMCVADSF